MWNDNGSKRMNMKWMNMISGNTLHQRALLSLLAMLKNRLSRLQKTGSIDGKRIYQLSSPSSNLSIFMLLAKRKKCGMLRTKVGVINRLKAVVPSKRR